MEVVGAIASVGAILGGTQKALAFVWTIPDIPDDWHRLKDEIAALRAILNAAEVIFPPGEIFQTHTAPVQSALGRLKNIADELQALLKRVTKEKKDTSIETTTRRPSKLKWLYEDKFRKRVPSFLLRLHHEQTSLLLALAVAQGREDPSGMKAVTSSIQSIEEKFAIMTMQTQLLPNLVQEMQELRTALQPRSQSVSQVLIEDVGSPHVASENTAALVDLSNRRELRSLPFSCRRFCFCRCHNSGWFSRVQCDYSNCRQNASSRQATWQVDLGRWLSSYGVSISISASLRPRVVVSMDNIRYPLRRKVEEERRDLIWRHFDDLHPMDTYESTITILEDALNYRNTILLEVLMSHWEVHFLQYGLNRRDLFQAQWCRENADLSEREMAVMSKLISYAELDHAFQTTALHRAIEAGDIEGTGRALASEPTFVSMCNSKGDAPIHLAVAQGTLAIVMTTILKGAGADLDRRDRNERTALMLASYWGNLEVVEWLLKQGANVVDPNLRDATGRTALHFAVESDGFASVAIMKLLMNAGAQSSTLDEDSHAPLHDMWHCAGGYAMCKPKVELLISAGARIDLQDKHGRSALMMALEHDNGGAVGALVDAGASLKPRNRFGRTAFHNAALHSGKNTLSELRRRKAFCSSDADPFSGDCDRDSVWDNFTWRLFTPPSAPSDVAITTKAVPHLFEVLYLQSRNLTLQSRIATLQQINTLLHTKNSKRALTQLGILVEQHEPRSPWQTDVEMQPLRSIHLQLRDGHVLDALQALQEQIELLRRSMATSPWQSQSRLWNAPIYLVVTPEEDCEQQFAFACRMRDEGLARWRQWRTRKYMGDYVYTAGSKFSTKPKMMRRLMRVRGRSRVRRRKWAWTKSLYVSAPSLDERLRLCL